MSRKKKLGIKTLHYPLWFNILFSCLTILAPGVLIVIEGLKAPDGVLGTTFKLSFMTVCIAIMVWSIIYKIIVEKAKTKLLAKQIALEHDYSIDNGNPKKIKYLWYQNEMKLTLFTLISVVLYGGLAVLLLLGVASKLMEIKGVLMILLSLYVIAYTIRFLVIIGGYSDDEEGEEDGQE